MLHPFHYLPNILSKSLMKCKLPSLTKEQVQCERVRRCGVCCLRTHEQPHPPRDLPGTHLPQGPVVLRPFPMRQGISCDLDPDKVSGVSTVEGKSLASISKWVCPRFQFIIRNHRPQRRRSSRSRQRPPLRDALCVGRGLPRSLRPWFPWEVSTAVPSVGGRGGECVLLCA